MANANLPQIIIDSNDPNFLITERFQGRPAILSTQVAERFLKRHDHLIRDIGNLRGQISHEFDKANFGKIQIKDKKGESRPAYLLTRDAFTLLVMGMTGKTATMWKIRYIEAFNALEAAVARRQREVLENMAELARDEGYKLGRAEALALPSLEAERKKGYLEGMKEGERLAKKNDRLTVLLKIRSCLTRNFTIAEMGKILGLSASAVRNRIYRARQNGLLPQKPVQIALPGVEK